jgi:hypothetical protein
MDIFFIVAEFFLWVFIGVVGFTVLACLELLFRMIHEKIIRKKDAKSKENETCTR